jgi:hypothetical protein
LKNIGPNFEAEYQRGLERLQEHNPYSMWWERIYDVKDYVARSCPKCHAPINKCHSCGARFPRLGMKPPKRRGDFHVGTGGRYILIECKATRVSKGFPTCNLKEHQLMSLLYNYMAGCISLLEIKRVSSKRKLKYTIEANTYSELSDGKRFIPWRSIAEVAVDISERVPDHGRPYYDLSYLVEG